MGRECCLLRGRVEPDAERRDEVDRPALVGLGGAAERRIASLQAHDALTRARRRHCQVVDTGLILRSRPSALTAEYRYDMVPEWGSDSQGLALCQSAAEWGMTRWHVVE
jgi:hypothetical protein